jgi:hypothetical protein
LADAPLAEVFFVTVVAGDPMAAFGKPSFAVEVLREARAEFGEIEWWGMLVFGQAPYIPVQ